MAILLQDPERSASEVVAFNHQTFQRQAKDRAVIALSGGIDPALSLTLLARALPVGWEKAILAD